MTEPNPKARTPKHFTNPISNASSIVDALTLVLDEGVDFSTPSNLLFLLLDDALENVFCFLTFSDLLLDFCLRFFAYFLDQLYIHIHRRSITTCCCLEYDLKGNSVIEASLEMIHDRSTIACRNLICL